MHETSNAMKTIHPEIADTIEQIMGNSSTLMNLLCYVSDHYKDHEQSCFDLMLLYGPTKGNSFWYQKAFNYVFSEVPVMAIKEFSSC